jgi:hypothetical protein
MLAGGNGSTEGILKGAVGERRVNTSLSDGPEDTRRSSPANVQCWRGQQSPTDTAISRPSSPVARPTPSWGVGRGDRGSLPGRTWRTQPHF